tara:strand:+ start:744 stop:1157 length:414 start_codon:yes stop_codon:yes gene_type:complete
MEKRLQRGLDELIRQNSAAGNLSFSFSESPKKPEERFSWTLDKINTLFNIAIKTNKKEILFLENGSIVITKDGWELKIEGSTKKPLPIVPSDLQKTSGEVTFFDSQKRSFNLVFNQWSEQVENIIQRIIEHESLNKK